MSAEFKPGDKVRLVDNEGVSTEYFPYMNTGQELVVHRCGDGFVYFVGHESDGWYSNRFELVQQSKRKTKRRDYVADHARRTLRKAGLDAEVARRWVRNVQLHGKDWPCGPNLRPVCTEGASGELRIELSKLSRDTRGLSLKLLVADAFSWHATDEGFDYWDAVHDREILKEKNNAQAQ